MLNVVFRIFDYLGHFSKIIGFYAFLKYFEINFESMFIFVSVHAILIWRLIGLFTSWRFLEVNWTSLMQSGDNSFTFSSLLLIIEKRQKIAKIRGYLQKINCKRNTCTTWQHVKIWNFHQQLVLIITRQDAILLTFWFLF